MPLEAVASFTDAWIETHIKPRYQEDPQSHLLQMRGLKRTRRANSSHSKLVASFTDAWIETFTVNNRRAYPKVASFTDAWIET